jgi:hypothetical protein
MADKEKFFDSEGVPFVQVDRGGVFRMEGSKRVLLSPKSGTRIVLNSSIISRERAMELAAES